MLHRDSSTPHGSRLEAALALLDAQSRRVVEQWLAGVPSRDVADELALPEGMVEMIRMRSVQKVREFVALHALPEGAESADNPTR